MSSRGSLFTHVHNLQEPSRKFQENTSGDEKRQTVVDLSTKCSSSSLYPYDGSLKIPYSLQHHHMRTTPTTPLSKPLAYCTPNPVPNLPENNQVHLLEYRGAQLAAFTVDGRDLVCLPQAFELFLKHLVGGLHTVYTKLKRLEIIPVVCNVEQVRILRGLGAIQPGVNRCKLIAPQEFDILYADCTNSSARPGRPSKRIAMVSGPTTNSGTLSVTSMRNQQSEIHCEPHPKVARTLNADDYGSHKQSVWSNPPLLPPFSMFYPSQFSSFCANSELAGKKPPIRDQAEHSPMPNSSLSLASRLDFPLLPTACSLVPNTSPSAHNGGQKLRELDDLLPNKVIAPWSFHLSPPTVSTSEAGEKRSEVGSTLSDQKNGSNSVIAANSFENQTVCTQSTSKFLSTLPGWSTHNLPNLLKMTEECDENGELSVSERFPFIAELPKFPFMLPPFSHLSNSSLSLLAPTCPRSSVTFGDARLDSVRISCSDYAGLPPDWCSSLPPHHQAASTYQANDAPKRELTNSPRLSLFETHERRGNKPEIGNMKFTDFRLPSVDNSISTNRGLSKPCIANSFQGTMDKGKNSDKEAHREAVHSYFSTIFAQLLETYEQLSRQKPEVSESCPIGERSPYYPGTSGGYGNSLLPSSSYSGGETGGGLCLTTSSVANFSQRLSTDGTETSMKNGNTRLFPSPLISVHGVRGTDLGNISLNEKETKPASTEAADSTGPPPRANGLENNDTSLPFQLSISNLLQSFAGPSPEKLPIPRQDKPGQPGNPGPDSPNIMNYYLWLQMLAKSFLAQYLGEKDTNHNFKHDLKVSAVKEDNSSVNQ